MFCNYCGKELGDNMKFCGWCGKQVVLAKKCTGCGCTVPDGMKFCPQCGTPVNASAKPEVRTNVPVNTVLKKLWVSIYEGTPMVGVAKATGSFILYPDRIKFDVKLGSSIGSGLFNKKSAGMKYGNDILLSDIKSAEVGKYGGVYNTVVIRLCTGEVYSYVPAIPGSGEPQEVVNLIRQYKS